MARYASGAQKARALHRGDAAAVVELPGAPVCVEAAAGQGRRDLLAGAADCTWAGCSTRCWPAGDRRAVSLSFSAIGTFVVFVYMWLPFMILPIQAAIERIPRSLHRSLGRPGRQPGADLPRVILPLALPGIAAGSIFTFSPDAGRLHHSAGHRRQHAATSARWSTSSRAWPATCRLPRPSRWCRSSSSASTCGWRSGWGPSMRSEPRLRGWRPEGALAWGAHRLPARAAGADRPVRLQRRGQELRLPAAGTDHAVVRRGLAARGRVGRDPAQLRGGAWSTAVAWCSARWRRRRWRAPASSAARRSRCC